MTIKNSVFNAVKIKVGFGSIDCELRKSSDALATAVRIIIDVNQGMYVSSALTFS